MIDILLANIPSSDIPVDIFQWVAATASVIILALAGAVVYLFKTKTGGLTSEQDTQLSDILKLLDDEIKVVRKALDKERDDRRIQVEMLLREQKDIMVGALKQNTALGTSLDSVQELLEQVKTALKGHHGS